MTSNSTNIVDCVRARDEFEHTVHTTHRMKETARYLLNLKQSAVILLELRDISQTEWVKCRERESEREQREKKLVFAFIKYSNKVLPQRMYSTLV